MEAKSFSWFWPMTMAAGLSVLVISSLGISDWTAEFQVFEPCNISAFVSGLVLMPQSSSSYDSIYQPAEQLCGKDGRNVVLTRTQRPLTSSSNVATRPWSLHSETYQSLSKLPFCATPELLLQSLKLGQRKQTASSASRNTYFEPYGCHYKWYTASEACNISSHYSSIHFVGDSLSRHHTKGLFMVLTGDLVHGGIPRLSQSELYGNCTCDGQFSENNLCRSSSASVNMFSMTDSHSYGVCSHCERFGVHYGYRPAFRELCSPDPRPAMVVIQGGLHVNASSELTISQIIDPAMQQLNRTMRLCPHAMDVRLVWVGLPRQAQWMDEIYPQQAPANVEPFNVFVSRHMKDMYDMDTFDIYNMSMDAASSDGLHLLSEGNLLKAMYLLNLMDLWN